MLTRDHYSCREDQTTILQGHKHPSTLYSVETNQDEWRRNTITASKDGYRFYFDAKAVSDKDEVKALLQQALAALDTKDKS